MSYTIFKVRARERYFFVLLALLEEKKRGELVSSTKLATEAGLSQQETARVLRLLESEGILSRNLVKGGQEIALTDNGIKFLESVRLQLEDLLGNEGPKGENWVFEALVASGIGDGKYYMSIEGYWAQIKNALGFKPYPGTFNLRITGDHPTRDDLIKLSKVHVQGFAYEGRLMGSLDCIRATVAREDKLVQGALIFPERTHHPNDVVEFIAPVSVRDALKTRDGDLVIVTALP